MTGRRFVSEALTDEHDLKLFCSGKPALDEWLTAMARRASRSDTARVYVWREADATRTDGAIPVLAYYAVSPTLVIRDEDGVPASAAGGTSRIPGYLIGRLALDLSLQKQGYGKELLFDAITKVLGAAEAGGGRLIVVDAIDEEAMRFYLRCDFRCVAERRHRLFMKMSTARKALGVS